jgi:hypothetical protein
MKIAEWQIPADSIYKYISGADDPRSDEEDRQAYADRVRYYKILYF